MPRRSSLSELRSNPFRLIIFFVGLIVFVYGILGISVSAGLPPFSIVNVQTPIGTVTTNDHQYGGGLIIAFLGIVLMALAAGLQF